MRRLRELRELPAEEQHRLAAEAADRRSPWWPVVAAVIAAGSAGIGLALGDGAGSVVGAAVGALLGARSEPMVRWLRARSRALSGSSG